MKHLVKERKVKVFWDESQKVEYETYKNLSDTDYQLLLNDDSIEVVDEDEFEDEKAKEQLQQVQALAEAQGQVIETETPKIHNCKIKRTHKFGRVKIENVPPEEFLIAKSAKTIEDANFVAHKVYKTRSELIEIGFDKEVVEQLPSSQNVLHNSEKLTIISVT